MCETKNSRKLVISSLFVFFVFRFVSCEEDFLFEKKKYVVENVEGVSGEAARLPCNMSVLSGDTVYLVLWFKEGLTTPIYSYDVRELLGGQPKHWWDADLLGSRAYFNAGSSPSHLLLEGLVQNDAGLYKCRVDFQRAPTRNTRVNLTVVVPPRNIVMIEDSGSEVRTYIGPVTEGADLHVACETMGGHPPPSLIWLLNDQVIDDIAEEVDGDVTRNDLTIPGVTRSMLRAHLTCRAANNKVSPPLTATATIDMNLRPLDVTIHHPREPLSAGRTYEVLCSSKGSRPPAVLTWWRGLVRLPAVSDTTSHGGNVSSSVVRFTPNASDDGRMLACRAENRNVPTAVIEDSWKLSVFYAPTAEAVLGASLNPQNIREGDDVYFECRVRANPRAYKVVWKHNNVVVRHDRENGVLLTNRSLVVQEVTRADAGKYTCQASNVEGDATSPPITLSVQYAPVCRSGQVDVYGVSKLENARVACQVDAVPPVTRFYWRFNNTAESLEVPQEQFNVGLGGRSVVVYTPMSDLDYGTLLCSAENMVGRQGEPCVFHIIPATQPEAPTNCTLYNVSASSLSVACSPGFDGGLNQTFAMEVYGTNPHMLKDNITNHVPRFQVTGLDNDSEFQLIVYAGNAKGRSGITRLVALTQKLPVKQLETRLSGGQSGAANQNALSVEVTPLLGVVAGIVLVLIVIAIVIIVILRVQCGANARRHQAQQREAGKNSDKQQQQPPPQHQQQQHKKQQQQKLQHVGSIGDRHEHHQLHLHQDDQSPDVVACSGDCDEVTVTIRGGSSQHRLHCHQPQHSPSQHHQHCQTQQQQQLQHQPSAQALGQVGGHEAIHYAHTIHAPHSHHDPRHAHLLRNAAYTTPRSCGRADLELHLSDALSMESGTPPAPAPPEDIPVPAMYAGGGGGGPGLARIPEDPESPQSGRRESAV